MIIPYLHFNSDDFSQKKLKNFVSYERTNERTNKNRPKIDSTNEHVRSKKKSERTNEPFGMFVFVDTSKCTIESL